MTVRAPIDRRALGRALSRLADASVEEVLALAAADALAGSDAQPPRDAQLAADVNPPDDAQGTVPRIGITGPPGAGKSSLGGRLALLRTRGPAGTRRMGLLAIDPSSPRSGGAILGDRIRIDELEGAAELYVRSLASRSAADGLADNLPELLHAMARAGFDELMVETVGVGQAEHAARSLVDTLVLVLVPGSGDAIQAMKAGIMELADVYVVNKADLAGAAQVAADVKRILRAFPAAPGAWVPPVITTSIGDAASIEALSAEIDRHQAWLRQAGLERERRLARARYRLRSLLERRVAQTVAALPPEFFDAAYAAQVERAFQRLAPPSGDG